MLGALESAAPDPNDPATTACQAPPNRDYTPHLKADALKGARIGIPKAFFFDPVTPPGEKEPRGGLNPAQRKAMDEALAVLKQAGAEIVEADIPSIVDPDSKNNFLLWGTCAGPSDVRGKDANCSSALKYGMKRDFNAYLASLGDKAPVKTLTELRRWNLAHANMGAIKYGPGAARCLGRSGPRARSRQVGGRSQEGHPVGRDARHRRDAEGSQARCDPLPRRQRRGNCRQAGLPDRHRAVCDGAQRAAQQHVPTGFRPEAGALRRELQRHRLQRARD